MPLTTETVTEYTAELIVRKVKSLQEKENSLQIISQVENHVASVTIHAAGLISLREKIVEHVGLLKE